MKKIFCLLILVVYSKLTLAQKKSEDNASGFNQIIEKFTESLKWDPFLGRVNDSVSPQNLYETDEFKLSISENPIPFDTFHKVLINPSFTDDFEDYDDNYINYPVSYSVIYDNRLVSLFRNGGFVCHSLKDFSRDIDFENKLNSKKFKYHWVINGELGALSGSTIYLYSNGRWIRYKERFPLESQPKLFEDEDYIVFNDCNGEWGGIVYFFDKETEEIYFTESTCSNTVIKDRASYLVVAHMGHMMGSTSIKEIKNPSLLEKCTKSFLNKRRSGRILNYYDDSSAFEYRFKGFEILLFSSFEVDDRRLYLAHINDMTFIVELKNQRTEIVSPLFNDGFYTHNPITKTFGPYTLINMDYYGTAKDKEVSILILKGNTITKLDWNKIQNL